MKKTIVTSVVIMATTFSLMAQSAKSIDNYRFSLNAGLSFNSLKPTAELADDYKITKGGGHTGFSFGIQVDKALNEKYTIFSGLGLDWRGGGITAAIDAGKTPAANYLKSASVAYRQQYISVPLGIKLKAIETGKIKTFAQASADLAILIAQKGDYIGTLNDSASSAVPIQNFNKIARSNYVDLGWNLGIGAEYAVSKENAVYAILGYRNGIIDHTIPKTNIDGTKFSDGNVRSNSFAIRVGYYF